jgi:hypothetical protein
MNPSNRHFLDPTEQYDILHNVGLELLGSAPEGWKEITFITTSLGGISQSEMLVQNEDGDVRRQRFPHGVMRKFAQLRAGMYQDGRGTWFSMTYTIIPPGKFSTQFNYDNPPEFTIPPSASSYAADLEAFPREPKNIPDWLHQKLREAETEQD